MMSGAVASAQRFAGDWMTSGNDAQRSSWVRSDAKISPQSLQKPGFQLEWKLKLENSARQLNTLTQPALLDFYIGYRGFRSLGFFGAASDRVIAVDTDLARIEWEKNFSPPGSAPAGTPPCPGGMTSPVTRPTGTAYPMIPAGRGAGRATPAKSGVGLPYEGAVTLKDTPRPAPPPPPPPSAKPGAPSAEPLNPFAPRVQYVLALSSDGKLHFMWASNGHEPNPPIDFLPPNAHAMGLIAYEDTAYVATKNGCGGVEDGVWALDLTTKKVSRWKSTGKSVAGFASGPDGTLYVAGGGELTALAPRTLNTLAGYNTGGALLTSSPVVFEFKGKDLIAVASNDGRLHLLDAAALSSGARLAGSAPFSSADFPVRSLASWQDAAGARWVLAAAGGPVPSGEVKNGAIVAWKVVEKSGLPALEPAWVSRDLIAPLPPLVINGVVFALSSGEFRSKDAKETAARSQPAVLYALDAASGKELWNSGNVITSFAHSGGLAAGGSRVYVATYDGTQYAFGFPIEH